MSAREGNRLSLILVIVFPAIVCATLALSYYGYRYAKTTSERSKASLMEGNRQLAQTLASSIQQRIDTVDFELFKQIDWEGTAPAALTSSAPEPEAEPELSAAVESVVVLDRDFHIRQIHPAPEARRRTRELERWQNTVRGLDWDSLQPWTSAQAGNFRHLHQLFEGKSVLIAYAAKTSDSGEEYFVAAKMNLGLIAKQWLPEEVRAL